MTQPFARDSRQIVRDPEGWNAGPPPALLGGTFLTPTPLFFTRSHAPVPAVDAAAWRLKVHGLVKRPLEVGLDLLRQQFARREVMATLGCAGLRRAELHAVRPVPGELLWGTEAVGNGVWAGVELAQLLTLAELEADAAQVEFVGRDEVCRDDRRFGFGGSIPLAKAMSPEVLLAYELNGSPLPPEHGFPVRAVVPGYYGARSVKWLREVVVRADPSANYFQTRAYRVQRTPDPAHPRDVSAGEPLGELALNTAILSPQAEERLWAGEVPVLGWAMGHGAGPLARVEVSSDGGRSWVNADFLGEERPWAWRLWRADVRLLPGRHMLVARAFEPSGAAQPERLEEAWNVKGYANNAWHRVAVEVVG